MMMSSFAGKRPRTHDAVAYRSSKAQTPGKKTLTMRLREEIHAQVTDVCDAGGEECFLDGKDRDRLDSLINGRIDRAAINWSTALTNKRIDVLADHKEGWTSLWKVAAFVAMSGLTEGTGLAIEWLADAVESAEATQIAARLVNHEEAVHSALDFAGDAVTDKLKSKKDEEANDPAHEKAAFLASKLDQPVRWADALRRHYPHALKDYGRLLLYGLLDPNLMSVSKFTVRVEELLQRWQAQAGSLGQAAKGTDKTVRTVVWVNPTNGGTPRLALIYAWIPPGDPDNNLIPAEFIEWVDDDMAPAALEAQEKRKLACGGMTTLARLGNAPRDAKTQEWDQGAGVKETGPEPWEAWSHEEPKK